MKRQKEDNNCSHSLQTGSLWAHLHPLARLNLSLGIILSQCIAKHVCPGLHLSCYIPSYTQMFWNVLILQTLFSASPLGLRYSVVCFHLLSLVLVVIYHL